MVGPAGDGGLRGGGEGADAANTFHGSCCSAEEHHFAACACENGLNMLGT